MCKLENMPSRRDKDFARNIRGMFSAIAPRYDLLNTLLSAGRDRYWRREAVHSLQPQPGERFLDLAAGTADVALEIAARDRPGVRVCAADFSLDMLRLARDKLPAAGASVYLHQADAENLPYRDSAFDGVISAFGVRNFADLERGLFECLRVLKTNGRLVILEFSLPERTPFRQIYSIYFNHLLPFMGKMVSRHDNAYRYLPESVGGFPLPNDVIRRLQTIGFRQVTARPLTCGIVTLYQGRK